MRIIPEAAEGLKAQARDGIEWIDGQLGDQQFLCGDRLTMADLMLFAFLDFGVNVGQPLPEGCPMIEAWYARMKERKSAAATA